MVWNWSRLPESDVELKEWQECQEVLNEVMLSDNKDVWFWNDGSQDGFSVKAVKKVLITERGNCHLPNFDWCKWVPLKCNIVAWRGNLDRLATRVHLRRRNVDLISVMCPFYGDFEETVEHLFTACAMANRVWFLLDACRDTTLIILMVAAAASLALGIKTEWIKEGWYNWGSIALAVIIVIVVTL
ncbi:uncharacterized protein LOC110901606 [Helianthus annuus]|uniref:uncharacterized protein LOC110901606 n=1 Tax=Helianthus annuus TaxID=4232 RepID=UPI000B908DC8|nr:uncharacterized protein LOC110901606 [Helianthus annuus]